MKTDNKISALTLKDVNKKVTTIEVKPNTKLILPNGIEINVLAQIKRTSTDSLFSKTNNRVLDGITINVTENVEISKALEYDRAVNVSTTSMKFSNEGEIKRTDVHMRDPEAIDYDTIKATGKKCGHQVSTEKERKSRNRTTVVTTAGLSDCRPERVVIHNYNDTK